MEIASTFHELIGLPADIIFSNKPKYAFLNVCIVRVCISLYK